MSDLLPVAAQYGLPGLLIVGVLWLVWTRGTSIDLSIRIPPKRRDRGGKGGSRPLC